MADISKRDAETLNVNRFNYAVYRVLLRMLQADGSKFAVFINDQVVRFVNPDADYYERVMKKEWPSFVGVFHSRSNIEQVIEVLKPHFTEERGLIESHLYV